MPSALLAFTVVVAVDSACPAGWTSGCNGCYGPQNRTFAYEEAVHQCHSVLGEPHSIHNIEEAQIIGLTGAFAYAEEYGGAAAAIWVGLECNDSQHVANKSSWTWADGTQVDYDIWLPGYPQNDARRIRGYLTVTKVDGGIKANFANGAPAQKLGVVCKRNAH